MIWFWLSRLHIICSIYALKIVSATTTKTCLTTIFSVQLMKRKVYIYRLTIMWVHLFFRNHLPIEKHALTLSFTDLQYFQHMEFPNTIIKACKCTAGIHCDYNPWRVALRVVLLISFILYHCLIFVSMLIFLN